MTRDSVAYENYNTFAKYSYNGIDNVFFVNKLDIPEVRTIPEKYVVINIEEPKHDEIKKQLIKELSVAGEKIIFSNHKPYPYSKISKNVKEGIIVSDYPLDYLIMYKNASAVYSDRVHGNRATLFSDSPRKALFKNVGIEKVDGNSMDAMYLKELQDKQIVFLSKIFKEELGKRNE